MSDLISRQAAIDALWKALYDYEDKTEKQFQESDELDVGDWMQHRIFVQNMNDIDRQTIFNLPSAQPRKGKWLADNNNYFAPHFICSECKQSFRVDTVMMMPVWDFCPNCGADMRGEENA